MTEDVRPIPERLMAPWVEDNQQFLAELAARLDLLDTADEVRDMLKIQAFTRCDPVPLCAVDAAVVDVPIGDILTVLVQGLHVDDYGQTTFGSPIRVTGVNGHDLSLARTPLRLMAECALLRESVSPAMTIADTSYWSMLMEINQTITRHANGGAGNPGIDRAYAALVTDGGFFAMLQNPQVIAMSKTSQSTKLAGEVTRARQYDKALVSDRELLGAILQPGEYVTPVPLTRGTQGHFGVEERGFRPHERTEIRRIFEDDLGMTYFKPHPWARAFRIEARLRLLQDSTWLMPLLSAIEIHTADRTVEPWPQFLADWNTKHLGAIAKLYGMLNFPRTPHFDPARTLI